MAYHFKHDESVERGVQRCAREQLDKAVGEVDDPSLDRAEAVHQVRKRMKKLRGLVRLVRPALGEQYKPLNARFRDVAGRLGNLRDADVMLETFDRVVERSPVPQASDHYAALRAALTGRRRELHEQFGDIDAVIGAARDDLADAREQVADWSLDEIGYDAAAGGLKKTYKRARGAMDEALNDPTDEQLHEWRKRAKYHWHHVRLLEHVWDRPMKARRKAAKTLTDLLGDDHDLAVLTEALKEMADRFNDNRVDQFVDEATTRRAELRADALPVGAKLFAEKPKRLVVRIGQYWAVWRDARPAAA